MRARSFFGAWIRAPFSVGAVLPSSRVLAREIAACVDRRTPGVVVELGAGTGAVTEALLQSGLEPERLIVIERDAKLARFLTQRYPHLNVQCADAQGLADILGHGRTHVAAIVSSLPLLSMPRGIRRAVEDAMVAQAGERGRIVQFTYGPKSPISRAALRRYHMTGSRARTVVANVPPAHIWVYRHILSK